MTGTLREGKFLFDTGIRLLQSSSIPLNVGMKSLHRHGEEFQTVDGPFVAILQRTRRKQIQRGDWLSSTPMVYSHASWFRFPTGLLLGFTPKARVSLVHLAVKFA